MLFQEHEVIMLERAEVAAVKDDEDRHDLARCESPIAIPSPFAANQLPLSQLRFHHLAIIVHVTKQRFPIHCILSSLASLPMTTWGEYLFSKVRVWERGCGETLACGTGTCAAVAAANRLGKVKDKVMVHVVGGDLQVEVGKTLFLSGAAEKVFEGRLF